MFHLHMVFRTKLFMKSKKKFMLAHLNGIFKFYVAYVILKSRVYKKYNVANQKNKTLSRKQKEKEAVEVRFYFYVR